MYMLGIDVGSSFLKSSVLNLEEMRVEDTCSVPTPGFLKLSPEKKEIPMEEIVEAIRHLIERAQDNYMLEGIVFSVQMHGFMLFDPQGQALSNYISWQDMRAMAEDENGISMFKQLKKKVPEAVFAENGIHLKPNHSVLPLCHYIKNHPIQPGTELAMVGDGLIRMLTGQRTSIHPTVAASSGLYSLKERDWNQTLIGLIGLENIRFPDVSEELSPVAHYRLGEREIPVYSPIGDHQAAVLGTCVDAGDIVINIGTGGQISYVDSGLKFGPYETRPFFSGCSLRAMTQLPSGRSLNVLMGFIENIGREIYKNSEIQEKEIWKQVDILTGGMEYKGEELQVDFSFFEASKGGISGISGSNFTVQNLFCGAYHSMAKEYFEASKKLIPEGYRPSNIVCTGGVVRKNPLLLQYIREEFRLPCRLAPYSDDTMIGLLKYACECKGNKFYRGGSLRGNGVRDEKMKAG